MDKKFDLYFEAAYLPNGFCMIKKSDNKKFKNMLVFQSGSKIYYDELADWHIKGRIYRRIN